MSFSPTMLRPVLVTAPAAVVVSIEEAVRHCRADGVVEDLPLIESLIKAATQHLDGWSGVLGRCLINQQWRVSFRDWDRCGFRLPFPDVSAVVMVYSDADNAEQTVNSALYEVLPDAMGTVLRFRDAFTAPLVYDDRSDAVRVTLTAGYGTAATSVPEPLRQAILLLVAHWYQHREAVSVDDVGPLPIAVDRLIEPYRFVGL